MCSPIQKILEWELHRAEHGYNPPQTISNTVCSSLTVVFNTSIICLLRRPLADCQLLIKFQKEYTTYFYTVKNVFSSLLSWFALLNIYINPDKIFWSFLLSPFIFFWRIVFRSFIAWLSRYFGCILISFKTFLEINWLLACVFGTYSVVRPPGRLQSVSF